MLKICNNCKVMRKIQAKGLCFTCYDKQYRVKPGRMEQRRKAEQKRRALNPEAMRSKQAAYKKALPWAQRVLLNNGKTTRGYRRDTLTVDYMAALQESTPTCTCCGITLSYEYADRHVRPINLATLDRIIPDLGYVPSNVAIICFTCNSRKRNMSIADLQMLIDYIRNNTNKTIKDF